MPLLYISYTMFVHFNDTPPALTSALVDILVVHNFYNLSGEIHAQEGIRTIILLYFR